jgi:hypothetical protein
MDRTASLLRTARELRARVFRSLPWGFRVAHLFTVLASDTLYVFGRVIGSVFLRQKVEGMPEPPPSWNPAARDPAMTLPKNYYADYANKVYRRLLSKFRDPELVEMAMMTIATKFAQNPSLVHEGSPLHSAEGLVTLSTERICLNLIEQKNRNRKRERSLFDTDEEGEERSIDLEDPRSMAHFDELFPAHQMGELKRDLKRILPWAPDYLDMAIDGFDDTEIIGNPAKGKPSLLAEKLHQDALLSPAGVPMSLAMWSKPGGYKDKIKKVIQEHLRG